MEMSNLPTASMPAGMPTLENMRAARQRNRAMAGGSGEQYLKMDKSGLWLYGAESIEVQEGSVWAILPQSFTEGYIAWADSGPATVLGEEMRSAFDTPIEPKDLPPVSGGSWARQVGMTLVCLTGEDARTVCIYKTTAKGGIRAIDDVQEAIELRMGEGVSDMLVPVVLLESDHYPHKRYGRVMVPQFTIQKWESLSKAAGEAAAEAEEPEAEPEVTPEPDEPKPARRRRRKAA